jgi:hypothetical protein
MVAQHSLQLLASFHVSHITIVIQQQRMTGHYHSRLKFSLHRMSDLFHRIYLCSLLVQTKLQRTAASIQQQMASLGHQYVAAIAKGFDYFVGYVEP